MSPRYILLLRSVTILALILMRGKVIWINIYAGLTPILKIINMVMRGGFHYTFFLNFECLRCRVKVEHT